MGYRKWFAVSSLCAAIELKMLGQHISGNVNHDEWTKMKKTKILAGKETAENRFKVPVEYLAFLAGFTSTEVPCGITWEEKPKTKIHKTKIRKVKGKTRDSI